MKYIKVDSYGKIFNNKKLENAHVFVEMQADREVCQDFRMVKNIFRATRAEDQNLLAFMNKNNLPFLLKKQIFHGSVLLGGQKNYHRSLDAARTL